MCHIIYAARISVSLIQIKINFPALWPQIAFTKFKELGFSN